MSHFLRRSGRKNDQSPLIRTVQVLLILPSLIGLLSCQSPVIISGEELSPQERSEIRALRGVRFVSVNGESVGAKWIIVVPGEYEVDILSRRDLEDVSPAMIGIVEELECKLHLTARPGEQLGLSSKMRRGKPRFSGGYSKSGFYTEVSLESSLEKEKTVVDTRGCTLSWDCSRADRTQVMTSGCS